MVAVVFCVFSAPFFAKIRGKVEKQVRKVEHFLQLINFFLAGIIDLHNFASV